MEKLYKTCSPKYTDNDIKNLSGTVSWCSYAQLIDKSIKEAIRLRPAEKIVGMEMDTDGIKFYLETE